MENIHHRPIKAFYLDGMIYDDSAISRLRLEYIRLLSLEMKLSGYVPRLDIDPDFTIQYNHNKKYYEFQITMYGTYIGKKQAQWITGIDGTVMYTHQNKSKEYSQDQV